MCDCQFCVRFVRGCFYKCRSTQGSPHHSRIDWRSGLMSPLVLEVALDEYLHVHRVAQVAKVRRTVSWSDRQLSLRPENECGELVHIEAKELHQPELRR